MDTLLIDWLFVLAVSLIALFARHRCAYGQANILLTGQFLIVTGFTTLVLWAGLSDGLYYDLFKMVVYFQFYHFIKNTGDKYLSNLSLFIGGYHLALFFGAIININDILVVGYSQIMIGFMSMQLLLAFKGLLYGLDQRINHARKWGNNNRHGNL